MTNNMMDFYKIWLFCEVINKYVYEQIKQCKPVAMLIEPHLPKYIIPDECCTSNNIKDSQ